MRLRFLPLAMLASLTSVALLAHAETLLKTTNSWIGNTFGYGDGTWTQINITAIAVTPDGKVYTNAPWDESGAEASVYQNGKMLGFAGGTHGWGNGGGNAVAVNRRFVFVAVSVGNEKGHLVGKGIWPDKGHQWYGVSRRALTDPKQVMSFQPAARANDEHAKLASSFLMINDAPSVDAGDKEASVGDPSIGGLAASDTVLYVSNTEQNRIELYDADSMQKKEEWNVPAPGKIALAPDGSLWVLARTRGNSGKTGVTETGSHGARIVHFSAKGDKLDDVFPLPPDSDAADLAVDAQGRILIADDGPRQQVLFYTKQSGRYTMSGALGERGGIYAGVPGKPGPQRFNGLTGVGVDAKGNIYVSTNGTGPHYAPLGAGLGAALESYAPGGARNWFVEGLLFVDGAWIDPARPNSVYTGNKRFELDLSKPAGQDWKYAGFLTNRFRYPDDPVFHTDQFPGLPIARAVKGHTFLYLTDMYADHLKIYRFDPQKQGETAIPAGFIAGRPRPVAGIRNAPPGGDWIWRDVNGNGAFDADEFTPNRSKEKLAGGWGWWVDTRGDIWRARDTKGVYQFPFGGIDRSGNPVYAYDDVKHYPVPAPFSELHRAIYDPATDSMYASGYTSQLAPDRGFWKEVGRVLVRYDKWSGGVPQARYAIALPWQTQKPVATIIGYTVEGQYVFAVESMGPVHVYDKDSGKEIGVIRPGPETGRASGWVDVPNGISAARQKDGEYLVFVEEDARGKVMMYRWKP